MSAIARLEGVSSVSDAGSPLTPAAVRALVELTERALADGLPAAVAHAEAVLGDSPEARDALAVAIASAERAVAARADDAADVTELRALARLDDLTGALNRRAFLEAVDVALANATREGCHITLALCDLDGLKAINDVHGHPTGDAALRAFVDVLGANLRGYDSIGRIGGDEFGLILPGAEAEAEAGILARLTTTMAQGPDGVAEVRASFGTARFPDDGRTRDELIAVADRRLYEHKGRATA